MVLGVHKVQWSDARVYCNFVVKQFNCEIKGLENWRSQIWKMKMDNPLLVSVELYKQQLLQLQWYELRVDVLEAQLKSPKTEQSFSSILISKFTRLYLLIRKCFAWLDTLVDASDWSKRGLATHASVMANLNLKARRAENFLGLYLN